MQGNLLRSVMAEKGYSQRTLSIKTGIPLSTLNAKINGKRPFDTDEAINICECLSITDPLRMCEIFLTKAS